MSEFLVPLALALGGLLAAIATYRGIRRGGARYYTLEREALLRRASYTLFLSVLLFSGAVGVLIYRAQPTTEGDTGAEPIEVLEGGATITSTNFIEQFPPTETATPDEPQPTVTPTVIICRGIVDGTSGNGLTLRDTPGGADMTVLPDGSVLTVLEDAPVEANGFTWRKVRVVGGEEGWVAGEFLTIRAPCN